MLTHKYRLFISKSLTFVQILCRSCRMKRKLPLILLLVISVSCIQHDHYVVFSGYAQGGVYTVKANLAGVREKPESIQTHIDSLLLLIDNTISGYNKSSSLSRLNVGERIVPNEIFRELYSMSYEFFEQSSGAFDVASGPLFDVWGFGFKTDSLPSPDELRYARSISGMDRLVRDIDDVLSADGTLRAKDLLKDTSQVPPVLNFNAVAQGYSSDYIAAYLHSLGVKDMLVDIGEIYCEGLNPRGEAWSVGIDRPFDGNFFPGNDIQAVWNSCGTHGEGIVTSGNYRKFYYADGKKISHTIDPRTGEPVSHNLLSATIISDNAARSDAVATWCMVIGFSESVRMIEESGLEACLIFDKDGQPCVWTSSGFNAVTSR